VPVKRKIPPTIMIISAGKNKPITILLLLDEPLEPETLLTFGINLTPSQ
jgi:hypothetical protein